MVTLVASALPDDATCCALVGRPAPGVDGQGASTLSCAASGGGTPADRVSRELLARAWAAGAGPGDSPLTIDLDSTICETYGLAKEGARHHGYTGQRGLAIAAGTGGAMSRLREGRANTVRGAAHFLHETRVRHETTHCAPTAASTPMVWYRSAASWMSASPSPSASTRCDDRGRLIPYMEDVAETTYTPFQGEPDAAPVRHRPKGGPRPELALFASYSYHGFITDRDGDMELEVDHRRHAEVENAIHLKYGRPQPSALGPLRRQRRLAGRPGDGP